ncbi:MAG: restriction endonuclease subunit S, partial [Fusobacterium periodonticum]|nr:restriction endonuclease subunit S [Fusobacterium periodonticum]
MKNKVYNLFEICNPKQWKTISIDNLDNNGKYPVYGANGIIGYYSEYNHEKPTLCITCRGATSGELNISTSYSYINGNTMALDDLDETKVDINFLYYYLKKRGFKDIISGSAQPQITRISLKKINIPLYTLNFQKKVVSHIKKIEDIIKFKKNQLLNLTELVKSLFTTMFGDIKTNDKNWEIYYWKDVLNIKNG